MIETGKVSEERRKSIKSPLGFVVTFGRQIFISTEKVKKKIEGERKDILWLFIFFQPGDHTEATS
jgi:hypothetical protein